MSKQDEFESLIKNFKLDDIKDPRDAAAPGARRDAFNFDEDDARYETAAVRPAQERRPAPAYQSARPAPRRMEQPARAQDGDEGKKPSFQVNIDDNRFYEPSGVSPAPRPAGGGGGGGGGNHGGNRGRDDEPERSGGGVSRWLKALIVLAVVLGISVFLALFALASASDLFGLNKPDSQIEIVLPDNLSMSEIAKLLKEDGVITQPLVFQLYAGLKNKAENFVPGEYVLNSNMSYDQIAQAFKNGGNKPKMEVKLMFYEGMTLTEMADMLEKEKVCDKKDLFEFLEKGEFTWEYKFLSQPIPENQNRFLKYEGYFFPDTYIFTQDMKPSEVVLKFFSNFNAKIDDDLYAQMEKQKMTLDETITLASIIQKEAGNPKNMSGVSSVFHNRLDDLKTFPHLDSDVTSFYVAYDIMPYMGENVKDSKDKTYEGFKNQEMYEAYDTYTCNGLPAGAICNPGLDAIGAALNPDVSENYFFVTDAEGSYYYAKTSAEHDQNVAVAMPKGDVHGTGVDTSGNASSGADSASSGAAQ